MKMKLELEQKLLGEQSRKLQFEVKFIIKFRLNYQP